MPTERQNNANPSRPLMPTLASSRTARTPVAPRLAAAAQPASNSNPLRRNDRQDVTSAPNSVPPSSFATPANKNYLNSNVTPRSSNRKSRAGSIQSTPNDTPINSPSISSRPILGFDVYRRDTGNSNASSSLAGAGPGRPRSIVGAPSAQNHNIRSRSPHSALSGIAGSETGSRDDQSMFFHADEARSQRAVAAPPITAPVQKKPAFFYADGRRETGIMEPAEMPSPPQSSLGRSPAPTSQFFHANTAPTSKPSSVNPATVPSSVFPESSIQNPQPRAPAFRSPSPEKMNIHLSYRKGASQIMRPNGHRPPPVSILSSEHLARRRSSTDSPLAKISHAKTGSLSSIDSITSPPRFEASNVEPTSPTSPLKTNIANMFADTSGSRVSIDSNSSAPNESQEALSEDRLSGPQSPTAPIQAGNSLQKMNELAATARRERKVLDLEISNSSLLAVNRQLEREVRKQKAELRRYRRLSRAGRFSTSTARTSLGEYSEIEDSESLDVVDEVDEDQEEDEEDEDDEDDEQSLSDSSAEDEDLSPDALAERDARHAFKDEKRLQLDLSKHKELLVDSQKLNQSLKRCLGWTEELIAEGRKALEYKVKVSDVKLGGRVLLAAEHEDGEHDADEEEEDPTIGPGGGLLSPWTPSYEMQEEQINALLTSINPARTDRDSGIELELPQNRKDQAGLP